MKRRVVTPTALEQIIRNTTQIARSNPASAFRYYMTALQHFDRHPEALVPRRAHLSLPREVRALNVPGFKGYTLHIAIREDAIYLVGAYMPGLSDGSVIRRTRKGLSDT